MSDIVTLEVDPHEPACIIVKRDDEWLGDIEQLADGTWIGDLTMGNGPPSKPFATRAEAVAYVVTCGRSE